MKEVLGIDLGGTNFNVGVVKDGKVIREEHKSIEREQSEQELLWSLYQLIDLLKTDKTKAIGIGVPGIVDPVSGVIYDIQNIPAWKKVPLKRLLEERYQLPVYLNNDANCFALGEKMFGLGQSYSDFIGLSIGTGIGLGIIINEQLYEGVMCGAGEIGMVPYLDGVIEDYASSFFFTKHYQQSGKAVYDIAMRQQPNAIAAFEEFGRHLGEVIKIILFLYAPEAIVLGGSISNAYPLFKESMELAVSTFPYPKQITDLKIVVTTTSNLPILGAAALCF